MAGSDLESVLSRLGGVYRDPTRVSRDASKLIHSPQGRHLVPSISEIVENDGTHHARVLALTGTISMSYRGSSYNIPVDVYLPPAYPHRPPVCYVRPVAETMKLKENHRHVGRDGMVFMPYLHEWNHYQSSLVEMVVMMSSIFGSDPPVYSKKPGTGSTTTSASSTAAAATTQQQQPPRYDQITNPFKRRDQQKAAEQRERQAQLAKQQADREKANHDSNCAELTSKLQSYLQTFFNEARVDLSTELKHQANLEQSQKTVQKQMDTLTQTKSLIQEQITHVEQRTTKLKSLVEEAQSKAAMDTLSQDSPDYDAMVDTMAEPADVLSKQMLELVAQNAAITDCLYFLDKALVKENLTLEVHLKMVRELAKKQFLARAHMMKIARAVGSWEESHSHSQHQQQHQHGNRRGSAGQRGSMGPMGASSSGGGGGGSLPGSGSGGMMDTNISLKPVL